MQVGLIADGMRVAPGKVGTGTMRRDPVAELGLVRFLVGYGACNGGACSSTAMAPLFVAGEVRPLVVGADDREARRHGAPAENKER